MHRSAPRPRPAPQRRHGAVPLLLPCSYPRLLLEIVGDRGIEPQRLLDPLALTQAQLLQPDSCVRADEAARMALRAMALCGDDGLGFELGLRMQPTLHGCLGYALLSTGSIRAALELMVRFATRRQPFVVFELKEGSGGAVLCLQEAQSLGSLRAMFCEGVMVGIARLLGMLLGERMADCELWFQGAEPPYYAAYRKRLPSVKYGMPAVQLRLPDSQLSRRPLMADAVALGQAIDACECEQALAAPESLSQRVLALMQTMPESYPPLESVASRLCISSRTLKRRLAEAGTSYRQLLDERRRSDVLRLMLQPELGLQRISELVDYQDAASFARAVRRWFGKTPSELRRQLCHADDADQAPASSRPAELRSAVSLEGRAPIASARSFSSSDSSPLISAKSRSNCSSG